MTIEELEKEISLRLSLFSVNMAQANLNLVLGNKKDSVHQLLLGKGVLDEALELLAKETKDMFVPHGETSSRRKVSSLECRISQMQKVTTMLLDGMGIL